MKIATLQYLKTVTIKSVRDAILDSSLTENDTIVLHPNNFDDIVLKYRQIYGESINIPYFLLGVLIEEDTTGKVHEGRIGIIENDYSNPARNRQQQVDEDYVPREIVYRCGWCGNVVELDGSELSPETRSYRIRQIKKYGDDIVHAVHGYCCKDRHN